MMSKHPKLYPGSENEFSQRSSEMQIPLQSSPKNFGGKKKLVARKVSVKSTGTPSRFYGSRAIITKEQKEQTVPLLAELMLVTESAGDGSGLPLAVIKALRATIRKGANDLEQHWIDAVELAHKAFEVNNVRRPLPQQQVAWEQYLTMVRYAVRLLRETRGAQAPWRVSTPLTNPPKAE